MKEHDLIVIGGGSGLDVASGYASRGNDVAVVEPGRLGGTCLNRGCIPSKMLIHRAEIVEEIDGSERFGIESSVKDIKFEEIIEEVNDEVQSESESIREGLRKSDKHTLYEQTAEFIDKNTLKVGEEKISADKIVVAAGSRPFVPPIDGVDEVDYWVSTDALRADYRPESIVMVGGGYISLELAFFYDAMGTEVTILERGDRLLKREDRDVSEKITGIADDRYSVEVGVEASQIREEGDEKVVETANGGEFRADEILIATGRVPNTDSLKVEEAGIETTERGFIETDENMKTSVDGIYALGDIADNWMFKHSANYEAEIVYKNLVTGDKYELEKTEMPHAVFTSPQIAGIGATEQELEDKDQEYVTAEYEYADTGMGMAMKEEEGFVKVLASEEGEILGCHIIGPEASTLIHEVVVAKDCGEGHIDEIKNSIHVHPALNEVVQRAFNQL